MLVEATHAGCRSFSLLICTYLHDILAVHLFNAGLPCMASSRARARTQPVASVIHRLPCEAVHSASDLYVRTCHLFTREWVRGGTGVVRVWNGYGTVWNGVWNETAHSSTAATTQRIFINHAAQPLSKLADWSESRLPAGWQLASASLPDSTIKHHSRAAAGSNCKWCRRKPATGWEGGRVTSNPFLDCQLATAKRIPTITQQSR